MNNLIFDSLSDFDNKVQKERKIREEKSRIYQLENSCGSCNLWMTSRCEREKIKLVQCNDRICYNFDITNFTKDLISKIKKEIDFLTN